MTAPSDLLRLLADPTRVRILLLIARGELTVGELQEILGMKQARISTHLSLLRQSGLAADRRDGKRTHYNLPAGLSAGTRSLLEAVRAAVEGEPQATADQRALRRLVEGRRRAAEAHFNRVAGRLGRNYCPGRSWEAIGQMLCLLVPRIRIADLGAGEGVLSQLLARRAEFVHCIDKSPRMVKVGSDLARKQGIRNLDYLLGDIEDIPLRAGSVDLALLSQALHHAEQPRAALAEAFRILRPGGRIVILDLKAHRFEKARELYADRWLGFEPNDLCDWLESAGFASPEARIVAREDTGPRFETLLAVAEKPAR
jgi:ArsR family transcriptional regulator